MNRTPNGKVLYDWTGDGCESELRFTDVAQLRGMPYDIVIVGAGVVGCALAYELSQYKLRILLCDRQYDVGEGTSKGNSAIIHTGFDAPPNSLEAQLVTSASHIWPNLSERLKIPFRQTGGLLLALNDNQASELPKLYAKALANGVDDIKLVSPEEIRQLEPNATATARGGLLVPRESIIDPFTVSIAFAEVAIANGVDVLLGCKIRAVENVSAVVKTLVDHRGRNISAKIVINAAGLGGRALSESYGGELFNINPRRGQFLIYDQTTGSLLSRILLPVPTATTKGKLVAPTIFGNLLTGPTAEDLPLGQSNADSTTLEGLAEIRYTALQMCPALAKYRPIASYAGLRCNCAEGSYQIRIGDGGHQGIITIAGVRSTGLTAAPALAEYVTAKIQDTGWLTIESNPHATRDRSAMSWPGWWHRPFDDAKRLGENPDYGRMVCFCENISKQEIIDALDSPLHPRTLDAVKRRTRVLTGRCQGFNCRMRIAEIIGQHCGLPPETITKHGPGTAPIVSDRYSDRYQGGNQ